VPSASFPVSLCFLFQFFVAMLLAANSAFLWLRELSSVVTSGVGRYPVLLSITVMKISDLYLTLPGDNVIALIPKWT